MTKEQAIEKHRNMWRWIAEQYKMGSDDDVITLKEKYLRMKKETVYNRCYCCQYAQEMLLDKADSIFTAYGARCEYCPIKWESRVDRFQCIDWRDEDDFKGLFSQACDYWGNISMVDEKYRKRLVELSTQIAELPEKEGV